MKPTLTIRKDAAQARSQRQRGSYGDERIQVNLPQLLALQHHARDFSFLPRQPVHSLLSGRHASRMRGRGLNFEEIRQYRAGDDIRTIDWKVTARLRSAHTRVFTEERDRPALLLVDQRIGMFFGSQLYMKSVSAAQLAALAAWRVLAVGDRVGAIVFNDESMEYIKPARSRSTVIKILKVIVGYNQRLHADSPQRSVPDQLGTCLARACEIASHDYLVGVVSDFHGLDSEADRFLLKISQHNDLIGALVHDPSASHLPRSSAYVVTDGQLQIEMPASTRKVQQIEKTVTGRIGQVLHLQQKLQCPILPISTAEDVTTQIQRLLGTRRGSPSGTATSSNSSSRTHPNEQPRSQPRS